MKKNLSSYLKVPVKLFVLAFLFLPPVALCVYWYQIESEELKPFSNFEVRGWENITPKTASTVYDLTSAWYESTKNDFPVQLNKQKSTSDFDNFKLKVSESITEKLGLFSYLPYHQVCLINRNKVYVNGAIDEAQPLNMGGTAIKQEGGYSFYATRGSKDCQLVLISKFRQASSSPELGYPIAISIKQEENIKRLNGENYVVNLATTSVEAANTSISISLHWWAVILAYFLLLFAWSFVFFQYEKILRFLRVREGSK